MKSRVLIFFVLIILSIANTSYSAIITQWNFNNESTNPSIGTGSMSLLGGVIFDSYFPNVGSSDPNQDGYAYSVTNYPDQSTGNKTAGVRWSVSTAGYYNIIVKWDTRHTASASKHYRFQYTTDGINWNDGPSSSISAVTWSKENTADLSVVPQANNNPNFAFRLVTEFAPEEDYYLPTVSNSTYSPDGIIRYDMVTILGTAGGSLTVTVNQASGQGDPTSIVPINFTAVFSAPVTDFNSSDVVVSGTAAGTKTVTVTGSGTTYNIAVSGMTSSGTVIVNIPAGVVHDPLGYPNAASTSTDNSVYYNYDTSPPTVTINKAATQQSPTFESPIYYTVKFNKPVQGFTTGDVQLSGTAGATTAIVSGSGADYTVAVSGMTSDGTVIATIPSGVAQDYLGNYNVASTSTNNVVQYTMKRFISVMTYNIHQVIGASTGYTSTNAQRIARIVQYYKPDVLCINELEGHYAGALYNLQQWVNTWLPYLGGQLGTTYYMYVAEMSDGYNRNAIISRYPLYDTTTSYVDPRGMPEATVDVPFGSDVRVYSAHLKAYADSSSCSRRQNGAQTVANRLINQSSTLGYYSRGYILTGDMNEDEENPSCPITSTYRPITTLLTAYLQDFKPNNNYNTNTKTYSSSANPTKRFDYVLPSSHFKIDSGRVVNTYWIYDPANNLFQSDMYGSDHLAVLGKFEILDHKISQLRGPSNGVEVYLPGYVVTASYSNHFYIQSTDTTKPFGIRVNSNINPPLNRYVNVKGTTTGVNAERAVNATEVRIFNDTFNIRPYGMTTRDVGGSDFNSYTPGVENPYGPFNIGLLVRIAGKVTNASSGYFMLDDGSPYPVKVLSNASVSNGSIVTVTGVAGYEVVPPGTKSIRLIKTRNTSDVYIVQ